MKKTAMPDYTIPLIHVEKGKGFSEVHNKAVALIAKLLHKAGFSVNYDHIKTTTPRDLTIPIKLDIQKRNLNIDADIAFFLDDRTIVFIEVKTVRINIEEG